MDKRIPANKNTFSGQNNQFFPQIYLKIANISKHSNQLLLCLAAYIKLDEKILMMTTAIFM